MTHPFDPDAASPPGSGLFGLSGPDDRDAAARAEVHVVPVPFDATTSYRRGAALGPSAVLAASHQVDLFDPLFGPVWRAGIWMEPVDRRLEDWNALARSAAEPVIAAGGVRPDAPSDDPLRAAARAVDGYGERVRRWLEEKTEKLLGLGKVPIVLGGDHSVPLGAIQAAASVHPGLGVLHFDAHADLREAYEGFAHSHASILFNVLDRVKGLGEVVQVGVRDLGQRERRRILEEDRLHTLYDHEWARARMAGEDLVAIVRRAVERLPRKVWVTFDVDGLAPDLCPNTGTPVPGGLTWNEASLWLEELARSDREVIGADLVEVSPGTGWDGESDDAEDTWDAIVGARLLYRLIGCARPRFDSLE